MAKHIQLIIGSTRKGRVAPAVAEWVKQHAETNNDITLEVVDLEEENLPFFNAAVPPAYGADPSDHAQAWAKKIESADGYIFLTAEYNRSIPASLKNAIDYLVAEWKEKPAAIVSYGYIDGGKSATKHLQDIFAWLKVAIVDSTVNIQLTQDLFDESGSFKDIESDFAQYDETLQNALAELVNAEELAPTNA